MNAIKILNTVSDLCASGECPFSRQFDPAEVEEARVELCKLLKDIKWFGSTVTVKDNADGEFDVRTEQGYTVCTFGDRRPATRLAELINKVNKWPN